MKVYRVLMIAALFMAVLMAVMTGCKYDVAEPLWYSDFTAPASPTITAVNPAQALGGVNTITITGTNFALDSTNVVYVNSLTAEIVSQSATAITIRRPNLASDSCVIKVVPPRALVVAKYSPYKITSVFERYGGFFNNVQLNVCVADQAGNVFVALGDTSKMIIKVTPDGNQSPLVKANRNPLDGKIGPDGRLYLTTKNRVVDVVDLNAGSVSPWIQMASGKLVNFCDWDANGYFYSGGTKSDLIAVGPFPDTTKTAVNVWSKDDIQGVRVYNGYIYLYVKVTTPATGVPQFGLWRHQLTGGGTLGPRELVLDWSGSAYSTRTLRSFTFGSDGVIYIGTDGADPVLTYDMSTQTFDVLYKSILPPYAKWIYWGSGNSIYMLSGNAAPAQEWTMYKVDAGLAGAAYY